MRCHGQATAAPRLLPARAWHWGRGRMPWTSRGGRLVAMRTGGRLLSLAGMLLVATAWLTAGRAASTSSPAAPQAPATPGPTSPAPAAPASEAQARAAGYVGSDACRACHQDAYAKWKASLHIQMTRPVAEATRARRFLGPRRRFAPTTAPTPSGGRTAAPTVTVRAGSRPAETYQVDVHPRVEAVPGLPVDAARRADVRAAGVLARGERTLARLEGDDADSRRRSRHEADLERELLQLPRHQPRSRLRAGPRRLPHPLDRAGHRLRGLPRPGPRRTSRSPKAGRRIRRRCRATARGRRTASSPTR